MPHYNDVGVKSDPTKDNDLIVKVENENVILNMNITRGTTIRNMDTGENWRLKAALPEQTVTATLKALTNIGTIAGFNHPLTAATTTI